MWPLQSSAPCVTGKRKDNQVPLDVKPVIGLEQSGSSAIQCLVDSDSPLATQLAIGAIDDSAWWA